MCPGKGFNPQPWCVGTMLNQLSCLARVKNDYF